MLLFISFTVTMKSLVALVLFAFASSISKKCAEPSYFREEEKNNQLVNLGLINIIPGGIHFGN